MARSRIQAVLKPAAAASSRPSTSAGQFGSSIRNPGSAGPSRRRRRPRRPAGAPRPGGRPQRGRRDRCHRPRARAAARQPGPQAGMAPGPRASRRQIGVYRGLRMLPAVIAAPLEHSVPQTGTGHVRGDEVRQRGPPIRDVLGNQFRRRRVQLAVEVVTRLEPNLTPTRLAGDGQDEGRGGSGGGRCSDGRSPGGRRGAAGALPRGRTASR